MRDLAAAAARHDAARGERITLWVAAERLPAARALLPGARSGPAALDRTPWQGGSRRAGAGREAAAAELVRGWLESPWPDHGCGARVTAVDRSRDRRHRPRATGIGGTGPARPLPAGRHAADGDLEWCNRRLLARIHRLTIGRLRREIEPVTSAEFLRFLFRWQHLAPGTQLHGVEGTLAVLQQLQGFEVPAGAWESEVLSRRVADYSPEFLDRLCLSGEVMWGRLSPHPVFDPAGAARDPEPARERVRPTRVAPIAIFLRDEAVG